MSKPTLGYWAIRGKGEPIRLLLAYAGVEFEDKRIDTSPLPVSHKNHQSEWTGKLKKNLGLDFPNLPYYIEGDFKLTESMAILRYLGRKHGLIPTSDPDLARCEMFEGLFNDYKNSFLSQISYSANLEKTKNFYFENVSKKLKIFDEYFSNKKFVSGKEISYLDFFVFECFGVQRQYSDTFFDNCENIQNYMNTIENLEGIKSYRSSNRFHPNPINYPIANWGTSKS